MTERALHVAIAVGATAGLYAVSLAGVTTLQASADARRAAESAPAAAAVDILRASQGQTEAALARIAAGLDGAVATYRKIAGAVARHEAALGSLGARVAAIEGSAASIRVPTVSSLPTVSSRPVAVASRPATNACTAASGKTC